MVFYMFSLASIAIAFLLLRRKKNAPVWLDLLIAIVAGVIFSALVILIGFLLLNSYFVTREQ